MTGLGWKESAHVIAEAVPDASGHLEFHFKARRPRRCAWVCGRCRRHYEDRDVLDRAHGGDLITMHRRFLARFKSQKSARSATGI
jgi:hypothetical protein